MTTFQFTYAPSTMKPLELLLEWSCLSITLFNFFKKTLNFNGFSFHVVDNNDQNIISNIIQGFSRSPPSCICLIGLTPLATSSSTNILKKKKFLIHHLFRKTTILNVVITTLGFQQNNVINISLLV